MEIRPAAKTDRDAIWDIFHHVIKTGDTYVFPPGTEKSDLESLWFAGAVKTYVAEVKRKVLGTYIIKSNQIGLGSHIANASYMVHPKAQGTGIGSEMCDHSLKEAKRLSFRAMQFNLVVSINEAAINLWKKFGFEIVGTIPEAFNHSEKGFVDGYVMYRKL